MNLDELKERLKDEFQRTFERLEENSQYNALRDRFYSQSPLMQKLILTAVVGVIFLLFFSFPWGFYSASQNNVASFEKKRGVVQDLFRVQKEISETIEIPVPPTLDELRSRLHSDLESAQLLPEQILSIEPKPSENSQLVKTAQNQGVIEVKLSKLNLTEIVNVGHRLQGLSPSVKVKDMTITASSGESGYFEVLYRLLVLKVMPEEVQAPEPEPKKGKKSKKDDE